jgi:ParB/RepB/Spo0J family partition protein
MKVTDIICDHEFNCRGLVTAESCADLADSIKETGLINPILVRPQGDKWQIVAGHRRYTAVVSLGWEEIGVTIKVLSDSEAMKINLQENLGRRDLTPSQEMRSIIRIYGQCPDTALVAFDLGKSKAWVNDRLAIRTLPDEVMAQIDEGRITAADISLLLTVPYENKLCVAQMLIDNHEKGLSHNKFKKDFKKGYKPKTKKVLMAALTVIAETDARPTHKEVLGWCLNEITSEAFFHLSLDKLEKYGILE